MPSVDFDRIVVEDTTQDFKFNPLIQNNCESFYK
jgi:hypothetical protein